ncbi:hypothetical protein KP509_17G008800 [Ceratopteris richardii]|nr:hypothetical protein KP509_17G008800 [Ceratopteris richardii]
MDVIEDCEKMPLETCKQLISDAEAFSRWQTGNIVSMLMPLVVAHLGETRAQDLFRRFQRKAADRARTLQRGGINAIHLDIVVATFQKV